MIIDVTLILVILISIWIGWTMRIYVDGLQMMWVILFALLIWMVLPYFIAFVEHSSANLSSIFYYGIGIVMGGLIFLSLFMLIRSKKTASGIRRVIGSMTLAIVSFYSLVVVLGAMSEYDWIDVSHSALFSIIPEWLLSPFE